MTARANFAYVGVIVSVAVAVVSVAWARTDLQGTAADRRVDALFSAWTHDTPGCAAAVGVQGKTALARAYGMADLEHGVANTPETIFEAGSVSKQFTAAAVLLLAGDGKLSLDDPVRKYVPELPDYGAPLTIRHMLTHTSGLRDWGEVAGIAGWPRTTRVHTHAHVLDIASRQQSLNFTPGTKWSYSNTGYNLAAIIVARVSGVAFPEFTRQRIFRPLGMANTSWRDDFTRVVLNRAIAYSLQTDGYHQDMPFEDVYGNGGLLTTVGDLLKWNEHFVRSTIGNAQFVADEQTPGHFNDGRAHDYAPGLYVRPYRGVAEYSHSGATAGYRAFLSRYPEQHVSIAVLCNNGKATPTEYAHKIAEIYLGTALKPEEAYPPQASGPVEETHLTEGQLMAYLGQYRSDEAEVTFTIARDSSGLALKRRPDTVIHLTPTGADAFSAGAVGRVTFHREADGQVANLSVSQDRVWDLRFRRLSEP